MVGHERSPDREKAVEMPIEPTGDPNPTATARSAEPTHTTAVDGDRAARPSVVVRPATSEDLPQVRAIVARAFDPFDRLLFRVKSHHRLLVAESQGVVVGGTVLHVATHADGGVQGVIDWVFADPAAEVRGVGSALRDAALTWFAGQGVTEATARIDAVNSASAQLHRSGGYRRLGAAAQLRRWGLLGMLRRWRVGGSGFDPGMQLWVHPAGDEEEVSGRWWRRFGATLAINALVLTVVALRSPRAEGVLAAAGAIVVLLGILLLREVLIRSVARGQGLGLGHAPWPNGLGIAVPLAAAFGVWFPMTGSATPERPGWRVEELRAAIGRAHLGGALVVAAAAWVAVLVEPAAAAAWWPALRRGLVMLALIDLAVPVAPMIGTAARHVAAWSRAAGVALCVLGLGPFVLTL